MMSEDGIFYQRLHGETITALGNREWIKRSKDITDEEYYTAAMSQARTEGFQLIWRRGGGASLGMEGKVPEIGSATWCLYGVPHWWGPNVLEQWLSKQGCQTKGSASPPRSKQQGWLVTLIIPKGQPRDITNMIFEIQGMEMPITASTKGKKLQRSRYATQNGQDRQRKNRKKQRRTQTRQK